MKYAAAFSMAVVALTLAACQRDVVITPAPARVVEAHTGSTGMTGDTGATGATGQRGRTGDNVIVVPAPAASR